VDEGVQEAGLGRIVLLGDKGAVDLQDVDGKLAEVRTRGVSGPEVVDGDRHPSSDRAVRCWAVIFGSIERLDSVTSGVRWPGSSPLEAKSSRTWSMSTS